MAPRNTALLVVGRMLSVRSFKIERLGRIVAEALIIFVAGIGAGAINVMVGSGTLITFPTLVVLGHPPLVANVSNNIGLIPGSLVGVVGYRRELRVLGSLSWWLAPASFAGAIVGAALLILLPADIFSSVVPALVLLGVLLVLIGPYVKSASSQGSAFAMSPWAVRWILGISACAVAVYGGYFGASQGVLLIGILGIFVDSSLQSINALKNLLAGLTNLVSGVVFVLFSWIHIDWSVVVLLALGSSLGGFCSAAYGRHIRDGILTWVVVAVGLVSFWYLLGMS